MITLLSLPLAVWLLWCIGHLALMFFAHPDMPHCTGFRIFIPVRYADMLTPRQYTAIYMHEVGHRHYFHAWRNYALVCVFRRASEHCRAAQELEADDYAAEHAGGLELAAAIRKLSTHPVDLARAERLEAPYVRRKFGVSR